MLTPELILILSKLFQMSHENWQYLFTDPSPPLPFFLKLLKRSSTRCSSACKKKIHERLVLAYVCNEALEVVFQTAIG